MHNCEHINSAVLDLVHAASAAQDKALVIMCVKSNDVSSEFTKSSQVSIG